MEIPLLKLAALKVITRLKLKKCKYSWTLLDKNF